MAKKKRQKKAFYLTLAIIILLALASLFFLRSCSASGDGLAGKAVEVLTADAQCKESDNGNDPDNPGVVAWRTKTITLGRKGWTKWYQAEDFWNNRKSKLAEYYCDPDGKPKTEYFACPL